MTTSAAPQAMVARGSLPAHGRGRAKRGALKRSQRIAGYLFVLPTLVLFLAFVGWPILRAIYLSLTQWSGFGAARFIGGANYVRMIADPVAQHAFLVTLIFTAVTTVVQTVVGLVLAVLVNG